MDSLSSRSEYADILPLTANFVLENAQLTWPEIAWGHGMGLVGWHALNELAQAALRLAPNKEDENLLRLTHVTKEDAIVAGEFARAAAVTGPKLDETTARKKWAYLLLKRLYEKKTEVADPLGLVEHIYADFDYPEELEGFVRWMPATEPVSSPEEAAVTMDQKWQRYLADSAAKFDGE
jgi:hypothetical protein